MDRLEAMRVFAAVVEGRGFSAASRSLGVPLPTVSRRVAELEKQLGAQLLIRSTRRVVVTDSGRHYYELVRRILESSRRCRSPGRGRISQSERTAVHYRTGIVRQAPCSAHRARFHGHPFGNHGAAALLEFCRRSSGRAYRPRRADQQFAGRGVDCDQGRRSPECLLCQSWLSRATRATPSTRGSREARLHNRVHFR